MTLDVLDGKQLVCPLNLTSVQAEAFTTLMPSAVIALDGHRDLAGLHLSMAAFIVFFRIRRWSMDSIKQITRPAQRGGGYLLQIQTEADILEQQMIDLFKENPRGGAESAFGKMFLEGYMWMNNGVYGVAFELIDVFLENKWIIAQLVAEEYYEEGEERCPYTPDALIDTWLGEGHPSKFVDPFTTYDRPNVTVQMTNPVTGENQSANLNPDCEVSKPPVEGFKEIS